MEQMCDGSRRPVRGKRHELKVSDSGHMTARCPRCHKVVRARKMFGQVTFRRHKAKGSMIEKAKEKKK
jgi:hypothetical protein